MLKFIKLNDFHIITWPLQLSCKNIELYSLRAGYKVNNPLRIYFKGIFRNSFAKDNFLILIEAKLAAKH